MKNLSSAILIFVALTASAVLGWKLADWAIAYQTAPAKTEQVKADSLPSISITNPKDGSYLAAKDAVIPIQIEPCEDQYRIEQALGSCGDKRCNVYTFVYQGCSEDAMGHLAVDATARNTPAAICAEKKRQYKVAQEYIVKERKERAIQDEAQATFDACKPEGAK